jgi:hypothetical protein
MSTPRRFPSKDAEFNTHLGTVVTHLNNEATRLQVSTDHITELNDLKAIWDDRYPKSTNPNTSTKTIRDQKNAARDNIEALLREIYDDMPASVLTTADRNELNLPERDTIPTPRGKINTVPGVILNSRTGRNIDVECRVTGDSTRPSRHPDSDAIEWRCNVASAIGGRTSTTTPPDSTTPQPAGSAFRTGIVSKAKFTIQLPEEDAGKMADVQCRWVNITDSSKNSEWSAAVRVMVMA